MAPSDALLRTLAAVPPSARVLDLACGRGHHTVPIAALGFDVWACDPAPDAVAAVRLALDDALGAGEGPRRVAQSDPRALGYPDAFADWVVASGLDGPSDAVLEALVEARRVLRPGGWIWAELPASDVYTPEGLGALALAAGLAIAEAPRLDAERGTVAGTFRRVDATSVG